MGLSVNKHIEYNGQVFHGYEIVGVEWFFKTDSMYILTEYFFSKENKNIRKLIKHKFSVGSDVNVDDLILKVHQLHG